ncbi:MAG: adenylate/guanylate cyclase domain-containing protein [Actinomycetota bacterium]
MRGLFIHAVVFAVVNALLVGVWLVTTGSTDGLSRVQDDPLRAVQDGFWPLIVGATWGGALVIHAAAWIGSLPGRRRRQRKRKRHERTRQHGHPPTPATPATPAAPASAGAPRADLAKDAARAAIGLVESIAARATPQPPKPATAGPDRQWVAVLFTDLVGSTSLAESLGDATWHEVLASHRRLVRGCVQEHRGTEVGTQGDGFLVRFDTPDAAVSCAVSVHRAMSEARVGGAFVPELRAGIHAGEVTADDNDLVGRVINLAARVSEAAQPGEILVTEPVADHLAPGTELTDRGLRPLKGFAQPRHLLAVVWDTTDQTIVLTAEHEER